MKLIMENFRKFIKEAQWGGFTGGAAPLDEPVPDNGPIPLDQLKKLWGIYTDMGMSPEEILQTTEFVEAGITDPQQLQEIAESDEEAKENQKQRQTSLGIFVDFNYPCHDCYIGSWSSSFM